MTIENMNNGNFLAKPRYNFSKRNFVNEAKVNLTNDSGVESSINDFNSTITSSATPSSYIFSQDISNYTFTKDKSNVYSKTNKPLGLKLKQYKKNSNSISPTDFNGNLITKSQKKTLDALKKSKGASTLGFSGNAGANFSVPRTYTGIIPNAFPMRSGTYQINSAESIARRNLKPTNTSIIREGSLEFPNSVVEKEAEAVAEAAEFGSGELNIENTQQEINDAIRNDGIVEPSGADLVGLPPTTSVGTNPTVGAAGMAGGGPNDLTPSTSSAVGAEPGDPGSTGSGTNGATGVTGTEPGEIRTTPTSSMDGTIDSKTDPNGAGRTIEDGSKIKGTPQTTNVSTPETAGDNLQSNGEAATMMTTQGGNAQNAIAARTTGNEGFLGGTNGNSPATGTGAGSEEITENGTTSPAAARAKDGEPPNTENADSAREKNENATKEIKNENLPDESPKGQASENSEEAPKKAKSWEMSKYFSWSTLQFLGVLAFAAWSFDQLYNQALAYQAACNGCWMVSDGSLSTNSTSIPDKCKIAVLTCNPTYRVAGNYVGPGSPTADAGDSTGIAHYNATSPDSTSNDNSYPLCETCYATPSVSSTGLRIYNNPSDDIGMDTQANGSSSATYDPSNTDNGGCGTLNFNGCPQKTQVCGGGDMTSATGTVENPCVDMTYYPYPSPTANVSPSSLPTGEELCPHFLDTSKANSSKKSNIGKNGCKSNDKSSCSKYCKTSMWSVPSGSSLQCVNMTITQAMAQVAGYDANSLLQIIKKWVELILIIIVCCAAAAGIGYLIYWIIKNKKSGGGGGNNSKPQNINVNVNTGPETGGKAAVK